MFDFFIVELKGDRENDDDSPSQRNDKCRRNSGRAQLELSSRASLELTPYKCELGSLCALGCRRWGEKQNAGGVRSSSCFVPSAVPLRERSQQDLNLFSSIIIITNRPQQSTNPKHT